MKKKVTERAFALDLILPTITGKFNFGPANFIDFIDMLQYLTKDKIFSSEYDTSVFLSLIQKNIFAKYPRLIMIDDDNEFESFEDYLKIQKAKFGEFFVLEPMSEELIEQASARTRSIRAAQAFDFFFPEETSLSKKDSYLSSNIAYTDSKVDRIVSQSGKILSYEQCKRALEERRK